MSTTAAGTAVNDSSDAHAAMVVPPALPASQPAAASACCMLRDSTVLKSIRAAAAAAREQVADERISAAATETSVLPRHILIQGADGVCIPMLTHIAVRFESMAPHSHYFIGVDENIPYGSNSPCPHA